MSDDEMEAAPDTERTPTIADGCDCGEDDCDFCGDDVDYSSVLDAMGSYDSDME